MQPTGAHPTITIVLARSGDEAGPLPDHLLTQTFPELQRICREREAQLVVIDPCSPASRAGMPHGGRLALALDLLQRERPILLGLAGRSYGWVPTHADVENTGLLLRHPWLHGALQEGMGLLEMLMIEGALRHPPMESRAFFYIVEDEEGIGANTERAADAEGFDAGSGTGAERLAALKARIRRSGFPVRERAAEPEVLARWIQNDLMGVIEASLSSMESTGTIEAERRAHQAYALTRRRSYLDVDDYVARLNRHLEEQGKAHREGSGEAGGNPGMVITGVSGGGKSALIAHWCSRYRERHPDAFVIEHYVGCGTGGGSHHALMRRVMEEIRQRYALETALPERSAEIEEAFPVWLANVQNEELVLAIDALNQLDLESQSLGWLPEYLQPKVRLIVSTTGGESLARLRARGWPELDVRPLTLRERREVLRGYIEEFGGTISGTQLTRLSESSAGATPLFLRTGAEEMRRARTSAEVNDRIEYYLEAHNLTELFDRVLRRLEAEHGEALVRDVATLIRASRQGLGRAELHAITGADAGRLDLLLTAMDHHLIQRDNLLTFYHDYLRDAVAARYLAAENGNAAGDVHVRIATFFRSQPVSARRAFEEPWQWLQAGRREELAACIESIPIATTLLGADGGYDLLDYWLEIGERVEMGPAYAQSLKEYERTADPSALPATLDAIARFLFEAGRYADAEALCRRSLRMRAGDGQGDTLEMTGALDTLVTLLYHVFRSDEAIESSRRALAVRRRSLGEYHPDVARNMADLGALLYAVGRFAEAEEELQQALALCNAHVAREPLLMAMVFNTLGAVRTATGEHQAAHAFFSQALELNRATLGAEHPEAASNITNMAFALHSQGITEDADRLYREAIGIYERTLGPNHPMVAVAVTNLAGVMRGRDEMPEAITLFRRALQIRRYALGDDNVETINSTFRLGWTLHAAGDAAAGESLMQQAIRMMEQTLGANHNDVLRLRSINAETVRTA
ncbi:MAG TPA: tetratricopeptide repeat protein [Candidatus Kapabacteria bacterium]|nr:tetratricopeptide repeat protein [Candidatus Kapabacteria bacterium]